MLGSTVGDSRISLGALTICLSTTEIELFTKHTHLRRGIARILLSKMLSVLDNSYIDYAACDFIAADPTSFGPGGLRIVGVIILNAPFAASDKDRIEWTNKWLTNEFGFEKVGVLEGVGRKVGSM